MMILVNNSNFLRVIFSAVVTALEYLHWISSALLCEKSFCLADRT
jgi:hypothetical protein